MPQDDLVKQKKTHKCSNLWTAPFLSSTSARYFHTIIISSMLDVHFARYRAHLMLCKHQSACFLHFCTTILKLEKLEGYITGPPVSSPRTFVSFPGAAIYIYLSVIYLYIYVRYLKYVTCSDLFSSCLYLTTRTPCIKSHVL